MAAATVSLLAWLSRARSIVSCSVRKLLLRIRGTATRKSSWPPPSRCHRSFHVTRNSFLLGPWIADWSYQGAHYRTAVVTWTVEPRQGSRRRFRLGLPAITLPGTSQLN